MIFTVETLIFTMETLIFTVETMMFTVETGILTVETLLFQIFFISLEVHNTGNILLPGGVLLTIHTSSVTLSILFNRIRDVKVLHSKHSHNNHFSIFKWTVSTSAYVVKLLIHQLDLHQTMYKS